MHASDLIQHEDTSGTTRETSHQCCIMRKAMRKEVGAGGRFDIFLDSVLSDNMLLSHKANSKCSSPELKSFISLRDMPRGRGGVTPPNIFKFASKLVKRLA